MKKKWSLLKEVLEQAWQRARTEKDSIMLHITEAHIYEIQHPQTDAYYSMVKGVERQTLLIRKNLEQPILSVQNNLLVTELEYQQYKLRIERLHRWFALLMVVIISIGIIYAGQKWLRKLYRKKIRERLRKKDISHQLDLLCLQEELAKKDENIPIFMLISSMKKIKIHFTEMLDERGTSCYNFKLRG